MNIYIGCALTHVPRTRFDVHVQFIHDLASALSEAGHQVRYPFRHSDPQLADKPFDQRARLCYVWDRGMVEAAELMIAEATYPSTGLGIELQVAESRDIPIILTYAKSTENKVEPVEYVNPDASRHMLQIGEGYVSLMVLGVPSIFRIVEYTDHASGIVRLVEAAELLVKDKR